MATAKHSTVISDTASVNRDEPDTATVQETQKCDTFRKIDI